MYNKIILVGRITADPEVKTTPTGINVCQFSLACDRRFSGKDAERKTDFISCVAWRSQADFIAKYFSKGDALGVDGSLQTRSYDDKNGIKRFVTEVNVESAFFVGSKASRAGGQAQAMSAPAPMEQPMGESLSTGSFSDFEEIETEDDIPF